jgi:hypothetical protein
VRFAEALQHAVDVEALAHQLARQFDLLAVGWVRLHEQVTHTIARGIACGGPGRMRRAAKRAAAWRLRLPHEMSRGIAVSPATDP